MIKVGAIFSGSKRRKKAQESCRTKFLRGRRDSGGDEDDDAHKKSVEIKAKVFSTITITFFSETRREKDLKNKISIGKIKE